MSGPIIAYLWTWFSDEEDLPARLFVTRPGSADLQASFRPAYDVAELKGKAVVRNMSSAELKSKFWVYQWWLAKSLTINTGAILSGQLHDTYSDDSDRLELREGAATPGFDYDFIFENIPASVNGVIHFKGYYEGNPAHIVRVQAWNYVASAWQYLTSAVRDLPSAAADQDYTWDVSPDEFYSGGSLKLKIVHESPGNSTHKLWINYLWLDDSVMAEHLHAHFIVEHSAYAELRGEMLVTHSSSIDLLATLRVRHSGSANLQAVFRPAQDIVELHSSLTVRNASSTGLHAELIVRQSASSSLHSIFRVLHWQELAAEFVIRRTAINPPALKAKFVVIRTYAELLEHLNIRQSTSLDLQTHFIPRRSSSEALQVEFIARHSGIQDLVSEVVVTRSASADLQCGLMVQHYADLQAHFKVIRIYTPAPIYGGNLAEWINFIQGLGSGFIMTPTISNDPTQKVGGLNSLKLDSVFSTGRYDGIRFGYHAYPSMPIPDYNYLNLQAVFRVQQPFADLQSILMIAPPFVAAGFNVYPFQRKGFYAKGLYWAFYISSKKIYCKTSPDGITWSVATLVRGNYVHEPDSFAIWLDGDYFHITAFTVDSFGAPDDLVYRRGVLHNDGSISWSAPEQSLGYSGFSTLYNSIFVCADSSGYPWVAWFDYGVGGPAKVYARKSSMNDGTFVTDFTKSFVAADWTNTYVVSLAPMAGGKMLALYGSQEDAIKVQAYDGAGSWIAAVTSPDTLESQYAHSLLGDDDGVEIAYVEAAGQTLKHAHYDYATNLLTIIETLQATSEETYPALMKGESGNFFCFWLHQNGSLKDVLWRMYDAGLVAWGPVNTYGSFTGVANLSAISLFYQGKIISSRIYGLFIKDSTGIRFGSGGVII